jgi:hypothetical protein
VHRSFEVETALNFPRWFGERILAALFSAKGVPAEPSEPVPAVAPRPRV